MHLITEFGAPDSTLWTEVGYRYKLITLVHVSWIDAYALTHAGGV